MLDRLPYYAVGEGWNEFLRTLRRGMVDSRLSWIDSRHVGRFVAGISLLGSKVLKGFSAESIVYQVEGFVGERLSMVKVGNEHIIRRRTYPNTDQQEHVMREVSRMA
jgi:hypothetical protein